MMGNSVKTQTATPAFDIKGSMLTVMVVHLYRTDKDLIATLLREKIRQAPNVFKQAPVVLDLRAVRDDERTLDIPFLVEILRGYGMLPIGVRGGNTKLNSMALGVGLNLLAEVRPGRMRQENQLLNIHEPQPTEEEPAEVPALVVEAPALAPVKIIETPVRSGQQVVAAGDLVILSMVSPGAEILAHRHIHVHGPLRGRALAGVGGDTSARIFCQRLEAELVSVAGHYQINEDLDQNLLGRAVQIYLKQDRLHIEPFGTSTTL